MIMCPLYPFHIIILYFCLLLPLLLAVVEGAESLAAWKVSFSASSIGKGNETEKLRELTTKNFEVYCSDCVQNKESIYKLELKNEDPRIASMESGNFTQNDEGLMEMDISGKGREWSISVNVTGTFLGFTSIRSKVEETVKDGNIHAQPSEKPLHLTVTRSKAKKTASKIFGYSVAALISFAYINFGCALDLNVMKEVLRKPIGPAIGLVSQFIFMPLCSFALGYIFPWSSPEMRLGLFVTGTSPGGGASNIWTIMFGGNLDLSVTMTAVSTFAAFFMMPFWIYVLGEVIIDGTQIVIPYMKITTYAVMLVVPLMIGVSIRKCLPKVADFMVKIMKPLALFLIIFILVCGIWSQFFMIKLIDWKIAVVGFALPWLGFAFGCLFSKLCRRERKDIIAIAVETGIQNTGMAIFMLWFTLDHPAGIVSACQHLVCANICHIAFVINRNNNDPSS
eukprot:GFUD01002992.1.p1 GENE.GFUD01002992.1~~GFUD01002992.1.p1  ORF type:complete len:451 (+),score=87.44 GFUD01002992.1:40-1392(+)